MSHPATPAAVEFRGVTKAFDGAPAVDRLTLSIRPGEFFSLLGPSGCGKTTTLRLLAGLEAPDAGEVVIDGQVVNGLRPYERRLSMVFQNYALFPHLSVERNVAFGLQERGLAGAEIRPRVAEALTLVRLDPAAYGRRMPAQLSGGERQRVALARALVLEPGILLLDEPLGAIDLQLRKAMQLELRALNRRLGITFVYVTHDQEEALTMSDRIAVMDRARVAQVGTPAEVYENPRTAFVARFIGESNLLEGRAEQSTAGGWLLRTAEGARIAVPPHDAIRAGEMVRLAIRPEWLDLFPPGSAPANENALPATVREVIYLGETLHVLAELAHGATVRVALRNEGQLGKPLGWRPGQPVTVGWLPEDCQVLEQG